MKMPAVFDQSKNDCLKYCRHSKWWRWGELNPRPKALQRDFLRAQTVIVEVFLPVSLPTGKPSRRLVGSES